MTPVAGLSRVETALGEHRRLATTRREALVRTAFGLGAFLLVVSLGGAAGGYFPTAWNWSSLALLWVAGMALLLRSDVRASGLGAATLAAFAALAGFTLLSAAWAPEPAQPILEVQRTLVYVAALLALLLLAGRSSVGPLLAGTAAGITLLCAYGLGTRLFPERLGIFVPASGYRLSEPIGYWNGLGLVAAVGTLLTASFAVNARARSWRAIAAAGLVVLLPTLYFTFSRGAWLALAAGLAAAIALEPRRLRLIALLLAVAPAPAVAVWLASGESSLRRDDTALAEASGAGHHLALVFTGLAAAAAATGLALAVLEPRLGVRRRARGAFAVALLVAVGIGLSLVFVRWGGPDTIARRAYDAFNAPPPATSADLNSRLASFSGSWRSNMWRAAWHDYEAHPWLGSGAGSYDRYWDRNRDISYSVRDAHSLYLEQLFSGGIIGLGLFVSSILLTMVLAWSTKAARECALILPDLWIDRARHQRSGLLPAFHP